MSHPSDKELEILENKLRGPLLEAVQPPPSASETAWLIGSLQGEFDQLKERSRQARLDFNPAVEPPSLHRLLIGQFRLNRKWLMISGAAVFLMLILVVDPEHPLGGAFSGLKLDVFPLFTPLLLLVSMLYSFRSRDRGMRAIETITPYPPALLIYSRMMIVTGLVLGWALLSTLIIAGRAALSGHGTFPAGPFLLEWLGISLLTGGTAMFFLFYKGQKSAMAASFAVYLLWTGYVQGLNARTPDPVWVQPANLLMMGLGLLLIGLSYAKSRRLGHLQSGD
ncbi:hypothetical protein [Paenibacillus sp. J22TS3]|uniref:hypothetical protein n=1 Tax=Paenibacillus sp. J22TS3 TaxID=2807192 RepID=UPI001B231699|nr:hypothetical protein [Paenibacillus sp. J22TS3]GIP24436.1 hypothetical protein J22TS3_47110 [Paenibacillus sp. J22TS3]